MISNPGDMKIKLMIVLCFCLINFPLLEAQMIPWQNSIERGKKLAQSSNKLIVIDFWAYWCAPCTKMDRDVWKKASIQEFGRDFIYMKFDVSSGFNLAAPYIISAIPTIMITDSWGKVLFKNVGYLNEAAMKKVLTSFPKDVSKINESQKLYHADNRDINNILNIAIAYQEYCDTLDYYAKKSFLTQSYTYFRKAKKLCDKELDKDILERIEIYKLLNVVYAEGGKRAVKNIKEKIGLENIHERNKALAFYVLIKGYLQLNEAEEARKHFTDLKKCDNCVAYVESVKSNFEE